MGFTSFRRMLATVLGCALLLFSPAAAVADASASAAEQRAVSDDLIAHAKAVRLDRGAGLREKAAVVAALHSVVGSEPDNREAHRMLGEIYQACAPPQRVRRKKPPCRPLPDSWLRSTLGRSPPF